LPCFGCGWKCLFGYGPCVREIPAAPVRSAIEWLISSGDNAQREFAVHDALPPIAHRLIEQTVALRREHLPASGGHDTSRDANAVREVVAKLDSLESDRTARLRVIEEQGSEIVHLQGELHRWLQRVEQLQDQLNEQTAAKNYTAAERDNSREQFRQSEADRAERLKVIERQAAEIGALHAEVNRSRSEADELRAKLSVALRDGDAAAGELAEQRRVLDSVSAAEFEQSKRVRALEERLASLEAHWTSRSLKTLRLWPGDPKVARGDTSR
jgi:small-conductance mechanosensitive channel